MQTNVPEENLTEDQIRELVQGPGDIEWKYEMRRQCQEILPGLFLGPFQASKELEVLRSHGITHIVCIRDAAESFSVKPRFPNDFVYFVLDVKDNEDQPLIRLFPRAREFIKEAIQKGGKVLVHCNGGISLSPTFVIMFVMHEYQLSWEDALHMVQNRRYCISPNNGFIQQLKEYESIYRASIAVSRFPPSNGNGSARRKRDIDDDDGDDDEEMRVQDRKRFQQALRDPDAMES